MHAWPKTESGATGPDRELSLPTPLPEPKQGPLPQVHTTIEAGFAVPRQAHGTELAVRIDLDPEDPATDFAGLSMSVLDTPSGAPLREIALDTAPGEGRSRSLLLGEVPGDAITLVVHAFGRSPRFAWLEREQLAGIDAPSTRRSAHLTVRRQARVLRLHARALDAQRRFVPVAARIERAEDPTFGNSMMTEVTVAFEPGASDCDIALPLLPSGDYRVTLSGFEPEGGQPVELKVPGEAVLDVYGAPR